MNEEYLKRMQTYLNADEYEKLIKCYQEKPVRGLRINKINQKTFLDKCNIPLEKIPFDVDGYYILDDEKYGNHPYHHLGAMYLQEPSAMAPVNLYEFKGDEIVLDLCAAPGGKSAQIAKRLPNGILFSNDPNYKRAKVLFSNMERLGFSNVVILNETPERLLAKFKNFFDVILVDAPCSGEGMMRKDQEVEKMWSKDYIKECQKRDFVIVNCANQMLKGGGKLIYSTCTFSKEEDEEVVDYLINEGFNLLPPSECLLTNTKMGMIPNTLRFYPFTGQGEGQFMALLEKSEDDNYFIKWQNKKSKLDNELKIVEAFLKENLTEFPFKISKEKKRYYVNISNLNLDGLNVLNYGIELGEVVNRRFVPYHHLFKTLGKYFKNKLVLDMKDSRVNKYIHGEEIEAMVSNGYGVIVIDNLVLGGYKAVDGHLKNHYPKGLRNINILEE